MFEHIFQSAMSLAVLAGAVNVPRSKVNIYLQIYGAIPNGLLPELCAAHAIAPLPGAALYGTGSHNVHWIWSIPAAEMGPSEPDPIGVA